MRQQEPARIVDAGQGGDGRRKRTRSFTELQSHHRFEDRFGRPGKGNDKGKVEGMVGYVRRNFLVPVPRMESFEALNAHLEERCLERMDARLRGHDETIGQRMERDLEARLPLPATAYDACDQQASRVSSRSLVRYKTNDYSAPVAYGHRDVLVKGYVAEVVISCGAEVIARHPRSYEKDDFVFDPIHYLPLLERKTAAPSVGPIAVTPNGLEPARPMVATAQRLAAGGGRCRTWAAVLPQDPPLTPSRLPWRVREGRDQSVRLP